jgi:hypothetical protein
MYTPRNAFSSKKLDLNVAPTVKIMHCKLINSIERNYTEIFTEILTVVQKYINLFSKFGKGITIYGTKFTNISQNAFE